MTNLSILGGKGMLGSDLAILARQHGWQVRIFDLPEWDITRETDLGMVVRESDVLVNCAAYTNVDQAETEPELACAINADAPGRLGRLAKVAGKDVLHISTDFVFGDDSDLPLSEDSPTNPLGVYGQTKLAGEQQLQASGCKCAVMRVEWTYGRSGNNFVSKIIQLATAHDELKMVDDQIGSPSWTQDVSTAIIALLQEQAEGIFHYAPEGYASRCEVADFIFRELGIEKKLRPCASEEFPTPARRPKNSRFDCRKIDQMLSLPRPGWQDLLREYLRLNYDRETV